MQNSAHEFTFPPMQPSHWTKKIPVQAVLLCSLSVTFLVGERNKLFSNGVLQPTKAAVVTISLVNGDNEDKFDSSLTIEDYENMNWHMPPSRAWLTSCAATLSNDTSIQQPFQVLDGREQYALGDCIKICRCECDSQLSDTHHMLQAYACWACQQSKQNVRNFTVIDQIFKHYENKRHAQQPDPNALVIHLRLGDVIENTNKSAEELLLEGGIGHHPDSLNYNVHSILSVEEYLELLNQQTLANISKIHLVGGSHVPEFYRKSKVYAHCLQRGLAKAGKKVEMWIEGRDPDQDFYFLSHAKKFMVSTGGFSRIVGHIVERNRGQLVGSAKLMMYDHESAIALGWWHHKIEREWERGSAGLLAQDHFLFRSKEEVNNSSTKNKVEWLSAVQRARDAAEATSTKHPSHHQEKRGMER